MDSEAAAAAWKPPVPGPGPPRLPLEAGPAAPPPREAAEAITAAPPGSALAARAMPAGVSGGARPTPTPTPAPPLPCGGRSEWPELLPSWPELPPSWPELPPGGRMRLPVAGPCALSAAWGGSTQKAAQVHKVNP